MPPSSPPPSSSSAPASRCRNRWRTVRRRRVGQVLHEAGRNVGARGRRGTGQRLAELLLRHLTEQPTPEPAVAVQVDVPAEPFPLAHIRVLLARFDVVWIAK